MLVRTLLLTLLLLGAAVHAPAQQRNLTPVPAGGPSVQRLALVIGNDDYASVRKLSNAKADARAMAQALEQAGFSVSLRLDLTRSQLLNAVRLFKGQLSGGSEAVFYFAGHGVQLGAANYLLPTDIVADNEEQVKDDGLPLQRVLNDIAETRARFTVAIIDACRDNPFPPTAGRSISTSRGLAPTTAATGQVVLFSAGTGQTALDRLNDSDRDPNGLFTRVLLREIQRPGVPVDRVLRNVRDQVVTLARSVGHDQVPALYDQSIGEFYFRPPTDAPAPAAAAQESNSQAEFAFWDSIRNSSSAADYEAYLSTYPAGRFAALAKARIATLERQTSSQAEGRDQAFWESIRASTNPAEYEAYLAQYPKGQYAAIARSRIEQFRRTATPAAPSATGPNLAPVVNAIARPTGAQAQAAPPTTLASALPAIAAQASRSGLPRVGDTWAYRYIDGWRPSAKASFTHVVTEVDGNSVIERISSQIDGRITSNESRTTSSLELRAHAMGQNRVRELTAFGTALGSLRPGEHIADIKVNEEQAAGMTGQWQASLQAIAEEDLIVPAGRFRALKLLVRGLRPVPRSVEGVPYKFDMVVWYVPEIRRIAKATYTSDAWGGSTYVPGFERDTYELTSYTLK